MKKVGTVIIGIVCITLVVGYYYYLSHKDTSDQAEVTEVQKVILKDLEGKSYPATPREVIKFYNRILCCYYNEEYTEEELRQLTDQALALMDQELSDNNPAEQYYMQVKAETDDYHARNKTINNASVCSSNEVQYATMEDREYAYVTASYFVRDKEGFTKSGQNYVLRKDDDNHWKILAFELAKGAAEDE